jgi:hypothetical protein
MMYATTSIILINHLNDCFCYVRASRIHMFVPTDELYSVTAT